MNHLLFVYGTLRRGGGADLEKMLSQAKFVGEGEVYGKMALVAEFPGVVDDPEKQKLIFGEVYELDAAGEGLRRLDDYEDCRVDEPRGGVYRREVREVRMKKGQSLQAWIYIYNGGIEEFPPIESGDFVRFLGGNITG